jgi:hypothetical protein
MPVPLSRRAILQTPAAALLDLSGAEADIVVYGATPGGIAAAVSAARAGRRVLLAAHEDHIGGIVSNGLTNADIGKRQAVGGLFYEFTRRVVRHYQSEPESLKLCRDGYWYEATVAEQIFHDLIAETGGRVRLLLGHKLVKAEVRNNTVGAIVLENRKNPALTVRARAKAFIDATYEGDLAALSGAPFRTGRESRAEYNEPHAGRIYMRFASAELLPGSTGEADNATQAYCFRFHVTNDPAFRVPIEKPAGFNRDDYKFVLDDVRSGRATTFRHIIQVYPLPNGRFELNSDHVHPDTGVPCESLDLAEECWEWPTASVERRREIYARYLTHNVGLIWLLQNDPEVPEPLRRDALQYGWHRELWPENHHVPRQVYVRQGRRILGDYVLTERDADLDPALSRTRVRPDSIAVLEWAFDPHGHHKYDPAHPGVREGYFYVNHEPFQVPYGVVVPRGIDGLLVPVACSASHVAYNALRMEPVFMALGEACGLAADLAISREVPVRRIPTAALQTRLVERRGVITFYSDLPFTDPAFAAFQFLGARGLTPGYRATKGARLTQAEAAQVLARVLHYEGKQWSAPERPSSRPLTSRELAGWLSEAGYASASPAPSTPLDFAGFALQLYEAIKP